MVTDSPTDLEELFNPFYAEVLYQISKDNGCLATFEFINGEDEKRPVEYSLLDPLKEWKARGEKEHFLGGFCDVEYDLQPLIQLATQAGMTAAFSSGYHPNQPRFFVFPINVPEKFRPYVLLHEVTEEEHQGVAESNTRDIAYAMHEEGKHDLAKKYLEDEMGFAEKYPHIEACWVELEQVFNHGQGLSQEFSEWLMKSNSDPNNSSTFFNQAIPRFLSRNQRLDKNPLRTVIEFYICLDWVNRYNATPKEIDFFSKKWTWIKPFLPSNPLEDRV